MVCGVISPTRGVVYWHATNKNFKAKDFEEVLIGVRDVVGPEANICLELDNAPYHKASSV